MWWKQRKVLSLRWVIRYSTTIVGNHGYSPDKTSDVWPFFIASGPAFEKGKTVPAFNSVDIYPLMCQVLGLVPAPNMGNLDNVKALLKTPPVLYETFETTAVTFIIVVIMAALVAGVFGIAAVQQNRVYRRKLLNQNRRLDTSPMRALPETDSMLRSDDDDEL